MIRINQYIDIIKNSEQSNVLSSTDPFNRSIHLIFDLVINQQLNPWDIDLVNFSSMYLKKAKEEKIDLMIAGRIIYMAWKVLRLQSDNLVINMETKDEPEDLDFNWDDIPTGTWFESDDGYSYTNLLMKNVSPPIDEPIRRDSKRKITLIELLDAFDDARKEVEEFQLNEKLRLQEKHRLNKLAKKKMKGTAHDDFLEEDITMVWKRIKDNQKKIISFKNICQKSDSEERIKIFLSILFLAYEKKIKIFQRSFPYGEIYIKTIGYT